MLLPVKKPLIVAIITGSIGSNVAAICSTKTYAVGAAGLFSIPSFINPKGIDAGFYGSLGSMVLGFIVAFLVTYLWGYKNETSKRLNKKTDLKNNTYSG